MLNFEGVFTNLYSLDPLCFQTFVLCSSVPSPEFFLVRIFECTNTTLAKTIQRLQYFPYAPNGTRISIYIYHKFEPNVGTSSSFMGQLGLVSPNLVISYLFCPFITEMFMLHINEVEYFFYKKNHSYLYDLQRPPQRNGRSAKEFNGHCTWRIIPVSKWLITMVSKSPKWGYSPYKWPKWLINGGY